MSDFGLSGELAGPPRNIPGPGAPPPPPPPPPPPGPYSASSSFSRGALSGGLPGDLTALPRSRILLAADPGRGTRPGIIDEDPFAAAPLPSFRVEPPPPPPPRVPMPLASASFLARGPAGPPPFTGAASAAATSSSSYGLGGELAPQPLQQRGGGGIGLDAELNSPPPGELSGWRGGVGQLASARPPSSRGRGPEWPGGEGAGLDEERLRARGPEYGLGADLGRSGLLPPRPPSFPASATLRSQYGLDAEMTTTAGPGASRGLPRSSPFGLDAELGAGTETAAATAVLAPPPPLEGLAGTGTMGAGGRREVPRPPHAVVAYVEVRARAGLSGIYMARRRGLEEKRGGERGRGEGEETHFERARGGALSLSGGLRPPLPHPSHTLLGPVRIS